MRKFLGMIILLFYVAAYIVIAAAIGERVGAIHPAAGIVYYAIAGFAWVFPLRPFLRWMQARDPQLPSADV